jgi:cystathionine beta-lyase family protein involved in aluminum resistance
MGMTRRLYQGLFLAPTVVGESLKGAMLLAHVLGKRLGLPCNPAPGQPRTDIIQAVQLGKRERVLRFCSQVRADVTDHGKGLL